MRFALIGLHPALIALAIAALATPAGAGFVTVDLSPSQH